jgi:hypothetical protein
LPPAPSYRIEPVSDRYDLSGFTCGPYALFNNHLQGTFALRDERLGLLRTYLLIAEPLDENPGDRVVGFFALEAGYMPLPTALRHQLAEDKGISPPGLPIAYLSMLARHIDWHGRGLGALLLIESLRQSVKAADLLGIAAVYLIAASEEGYRLYASFGFIDLDGGAWEGYNRMYLPIGDAAHIVAGANESTNR